MPVLRRVKRIFQTSRDIIMHTNGKMHETSGIFVSTSMGGGLSEDPSFDWDLVIVFWGNSCGCPTTQIGLPQNKGFSYKKVFAKN